MGAEGDDKRLSLEDAIRFGLIDLRKMAYIHPTSNEAIEFSQAANTGLMDVTLAEILPKGNFLHSQKYA